MAETSNNHLLELTADIVSAQVGNNEVATDQVPSLIEQVHQALSGLGSEKAKHPPAVPIKKSVQKDAITCLECGYTAKMLKRHLSSRHDLSVDQYRQKWGLPSDYPMTAPDYAAKLIAARPSSDWDEKWAGPRGSQALITAAYNEIVGQ